MKLKLICCEVFFREACIAAAYSPHIIDMVFTPKAAHEKPEVLRELLQKNINQLEGMDYDAVLLGYGICGNGTPGLTAGSIPLVIPRAHDCCTIFLGSREKFLENFGENLSTEWSSSGYMERGGSYLRDSDTGKSMGMDRTYEEFVDMYGEENAKYIWSTLHPDNTDKEIVYINIPETSHTGCLEIIKEHAAAEGRSLRIIQGDMRLIRNMLSGEWNNDEYLVVPPGKAIKAVYDHHEIITLK